MKQKSFTPMGTTNAIYSKVEKGRGVAGPLLLNFEPQLELGDFSVIKKKEKKYYR